MRNKRLAWLFDEAIATLKEYEPAEGYYVAFSGGKDSIVMLDLVRRSRDISSEHSSFADP